MGYTRAANLRPLRSLLVFHRDTLRRERYFSGARADQPANIIFQQWPAPTSVLFTVD